MEDMDPGEYEWSVSLRLHDMVNAKNREKFISPKFTMMELLWQIEAYPNGNTPESEGSFNIYLKLISMPAAWQSICILRMLRCPQTMSGYTAVSNYQRKTSLGWPDYTLSLKDVRVRHKSPVNPLKQLTFKIRVQTFEIRLHKNYGDLFWEKELESAAAMSDKEIHWKLTPLELQEMKCAYFRKGFISPIYHDMWCIRVYPNGKKERGNFLVQLQLCGLPKQTNKLKVKWSIECPQRNIKIGWKTEFDATNSCWGWGTGHFTFDDFQQCASFEIVVHISMNEEEDNIVAMREWEHFNREYIDWHCPEETSFLEMSNGGASDGLYQENDYKEVPIVHLPQKFSDKKPVVESGPGVMAGGPVESKFQEFRNSMDDLKAQWTELKVQRKEYEVQSLSDEEDLEKRVVKLERNIAALMQSPGEELKDGDAPLTEEQRVEEWLKNVVKLPEYTQLLIQQGFDDLECIKDVTKEDLVAMGIDKVGHQRRILKHSKLITT